MVGQRKRVYASKQSSYKKKAKTSYRKPNTAVISKISEVKGLGSRTNVNLIYYDKDININGGLAGIATTYSFRADLFDPNFTGVGHQPLGFDQLMAFYERYCVYECEYKVTFFATTTQQHIGLVHISDDSTVSTNLPQLVENGMTQTVGIPGTNGSGYATITGTIDIAKVHGVTRQKLLSDDTYWGTKSVPAADAVFIHLACANPTAENGSTQEVTVELRMKAVLMGTQLVSQS